METPDDLPVLWDAGSLARTMAPRVVNHRLARFRGEGLARPLSALAPADRAVAGELYAWLGALEAIAGDAAQGAPARVVRLRELLAEQPVGRQLQAMQGFGRASAEAGGGPSVAKLAHEVRGGPLTALFIMLRTAGDDATATELARMHFRLRDHRKIMRSLLLELDDERRARDQTMIRHGVRLLVEKWAGARVPVEGGDGVRVVGVRLDPYFDGDVSECCLEVATLDRVFYNVINNALRSAAGGSVHVVLSAVPAEAPTNLHVAVANRLADDEAETLRGRFGADLTGMFTGSYSTTGSGLGLRICAETVGNAYGLDEPRDAVDDGYVGALLEGNLFGGWFHWPLVGG